MEQVTGRVECNAQGLPFQLTWWAERAQDSSPYKLASKNRGCLSAKLYGRVLTRCLRQSTPFNLKAGSSDTWTCQERGWCSWLTTSPKPAGLGWNQSPNIYFYCLLAPDHTRGEASASLTRCVKIPQSEALQDHLCAALEREKARQEPHICFCCCLLGFPWGLLQPLCWGCCFPLLVRPSHSSLYLFISLHFPQRKGPISLISEHWWGTYYVLRAGVGSEYSDE